jgi:alpha-galactosidase
MTRLDDAVLAELRSWIDLHKRARPLIGTGTLVHPDHADPAVLVTGIVAADRSEAWYVVATAAATATQHPSPLRLTGLDPDRSYRLLEELPPDHGGADLTGAWSASGTVIGGRALAAAGVALPVLDPEEARVLHVVATDASA